MKEQKMYVKNLYEVPEIRRVRPGHLVRCGHSSVYDVNFGKEAGACAVILLKEGLSGVTVVGINDGKIQYMDTHKAIEQRHVDLKIATFHESLGICFGRKPQKLTLAIEKKKESIKRFL